MNHSGTQIHEVNEKCPTIDQSSGTDKIAEMMNELRSRNAVRFGAPPLPLPRLHLALIAKLFDLLQYIFRTQASEGNAGRFGGQIDIGGVDPGRRFNPFSIRVAHAAQVIPSMSTSSVSAGTL